MYQCRLGETVSVEKLDKTARLTLIVVILVRVGSIQHFQEFDNVGIGVRLRSAKLVARTIEAENQLDWLFV